MRCDLCSGVSYPVTTKTSKDVTKRIYRCKKCGKVFHTIETKCTKCDIYENLLVYIKNLEEQVIELSNEVDRLKLERGLRREAGIIDEINTIGLPNPVTPDDIKAAMDRMLEHEKKEKELCPKCVNDRHGNYSKKCAICTDFNEFVPKED